MTREATDAGSRALDEAILATLADAEASPATVALAVDGSLSTVNDRLAALVDAGLVERSGFNTCRLTDRGSAQAERSTR